MGPGETQAAHLFQASEKAVPKSCLWARVGTSWEGGGEPGPPPILPARGVKAQTLTDPSSPPALGVRPRSEKEARRAGSVPT